MWAVLWLLGTASAQVAVCPEVYDNDRLLVDLDGIDAALKGLDIDGARDQIKQVHRMALCMESAIDPLGVARFGRQLSLAFFFDQDDDALRRWALLSRTTAPDLPWHSDIGPDHPFRATVDALEIPEFAGPEAALNVDKRGIVYWNGRAIVEPLAPIETPGLVQVVDKGQWQMWWQDGAAFPDHVLTDPGPPLELPRNWVQPEGSPVFAERAGLPLFGEAAVAIPDEPAAELVVDAAELEEAKGEDVAGSYSDPFAQARKRAIRRQYFKSVETNEAGDTITRKTEVIVFAAEDRSEGKPVTNEIFEYWLKDQPDWLPQAAVSGGRAEDSYLADWIEGRPAPNTAQLPVVQVPTAAAAAYCASFDKALPSPQAAFSDPVKWEWVRHADPVRRNAKGKLKAEKNPLAARADTGFRCVEQAPSN